MTTLRLENSCFMHIPKTGGTTATRAFGRAGVVKYDYRFDFLSPCDYGFKYDEECRLYKKIEGKKTYVPHPAKSKPHAKISELRSEDRNLPKIAIIRDPLSWYRSYWAHHSRFSWSTEIDPPYLGRGGHSDFGQWIRNMVEHSSKLGTGYFSRYVANWVDNQTHIVRLGNLRDDMYELLPKIGESCDVVSWLDRVENENEKSKDLIIPLDMVDEIRQLDANLFKLVSD